MYLIKIVNKNNILLSILLIIACNIILRITKIILIITFCLEKQENLVDFYAYIGYVI